MLRDCIVMATADFLLLIILTSTHACRIVVAIRLLLFSTLSPVLSAFLDSAATQRFRFKHVEHVPLCLPFSVMRHPDENKNVHHLCRGHQTPGLPKY